MNIEHYFIEKGQGEPLILLHGNGENCDYFVGQVDEFAKFYHVYALDTRGHGKTPRGTASFTIRQFADDLLAFMDAYGIGKAHVLGFSDGGNIAMIFAMKYPERVDRLILDGANLDAKGVKRSIQIPIEIGYRFAKLFAGKSDEARLHAEMLGLMVNDPKVRPEELSAIGDKWIELLRQYYYTGGMPEVVHSYITEKSLGKVRELQDQILHDYHDDISKHTDQRTAIRIHQILESIPSQLARENKKFVYGHIQKGARAKDFELALQWLIDAGLVYKISRVTKATIPLKFYEDSEAFKLYFLDCGLMGAITEAPASQTLIGNNIFQEYKGAFTEQYVLEELLSFHHNKIYYYHPEASQQEVDFLTQMNDAVCGIEVKAEENLKAKSLKLFSEQYPEATAVRFSMSGYRKQDWMTNYPLYLVPRIETE